MVRVIDYGSKGHFLDFKVIVSCVAVYKEPLARKLRINQKPSKPDAGLFLEGGNWAQW